MDCKRALEMKEATCQENLKFISDITEKYQGCKHELTILYENKSKVIVFPSSVPLLLIKYSLSKVGMESLERSVCNISFETDELVVLEIYCGYQGPWILRQYQVFSGGQKTIISYNEIGPSR